MHKQISMWKRNEKTQEKPSEWLCGKEFPQLGHKVK